MDVVFSLVPGMMVVGLILVVILIWAVKKGQYEDLDGDASRIILDDDDEDFVRNPADRKIPAEKK